MEKQYPRLFNQNDYGAIDLGNSNVDTIKTGGCFDCSLAMKACLYGHDIDPVQLNKLFNDKGVYVATPTHTDRDLLVDNALAQVYDDVKYLKTLDYEPIATDLNNIKNLLSDPSTTLTIRINFGAGNYHFVEAVACDGFTLHIANPISGKIEDFQQRYGNPVTANLHVLIYTGPIAIAQTPSAPDLSQSTPLAQRFAQAVTKATNFDTVAAHFGLDATTRVRNDAGQMVVDKIVYLEEEVDDLNKRLDAINKTLPTPIVPVMPQNAPQAPVDPSKPVISAPVFADGSAPVPSTPSAQAQGNPKVKHSPSISAGPVTVKELGIAIFRLLFL